MDLAIRHQPADQEFSAATAGHTAELAYSFPADGVIDFTHTFVDDALRGQGVGEALAREALAFARQQGLRVRTSCRFVAGFVQRHPEYHDLLAK